MSGKESVGNWIILIAILLATGLLTAVWPAITSAVPSRAEGSSGVASAPDIGPATIEVPVPAPLAPTVEEMMEVEDGMVTVSSFVVVGGLGAIIIGGIVVTGVMLAFVYRLLDTQATAVKESEEFQAKVSELEKRETERLKQMREGRESHPVPEHVMPRWSTLSTSLIILMFVVFFSMVINATFFPTFEWQLSDETIINSTLLFVGIPAIVTVLFLAWRLRPQSLLEGAEEGDRRPIPWDFIAVLLTGLIVVGLGIAYMVYINTPGAPAG